MFDLNKTINFGFVSFPLLKIFNTLFIVIFCFFTSKIVLGALDKSLKRFAKDKKSGPFVRPIVKFFLIFFSAIIIMQYLGLSITAPVTLLSVIGVAMSLALQGILSNIAGGAMLFFSRPFTVGNFIEVGGTTGRVRTISLVYTELLTSDNKTVYIPNKDISSSKITNFTANERRMADIKIRTLYDCPTEKVKTALLSAVSQTPGILDDPKPSVVISGLQETSVEYAVRAWAKTEEYASVNFALLENMRASLVDAEIPMPRSLFDVQIGAPE